METKLASAGPGGRAPSASDRAVSMSALRRLVVIAVVAIAFVLDLVDTTIVNVAIPSIQADLGGAAAVAQWIVAGYALAFAALLITGGKLGDSYGYRRMFTIGIGLFTLASLLCGAAPTATVLVVARVLQGAAAAIMVPQVLALTQVLYPADQRVKVMGLFGLLGGLSAILGPILGGLLIDANIMGLGWRPIFLINIPLGLIGVWAGLAILPGGRSTRPAPPDWWGTALAAVAMFAVLAPLLQDAAAPWAPWRFGLLALAAVAGAALVHRTLRRSREGRPVLVSAELFAGRAFPVGLAVIIAFQAAIGAFLLTFNIVLQKGLGYGPTTAALIHVPFAAGAGFAIAVLSRHLLLRFGRLMVSAGMAVLIAGLPLLALVMARLQAGGEVWLIGPPFLVMGLGMGLVAGSLSALTLAQTDIAHAGAAAGVVNATQQFGSALGVAVIGAIFFAVAGAQSPPSAGAYLRALPIAFVPMAAVFAAGLAASLFLPRRISSAPAAH